MDWGYVITGIVGIAGIGGTLWSGKLAAKSATLNLRLSISAEDDRARRAQKRRIYAAYLASLTSLAAEVRNFKLYGGDMSVEDRHIKRTDVLTADAHAIDAMSELALIAPPDLAKQAEDVGIEISRAAETVVNGKDHELDWYSLRSKLYQAMRSDLGESTAISLDGRIA